MKTFWYEVLMVPTLWLAACLTLLVLFIGCAQHAKCERGDEVCTLTQRVLDEPRRAEAAARVPQEPVEVTGSRIKNRR